MGILYWSRLLADLWPMEREACAGAEEECEQLCPGEEGATATTWDELPTALLVFVLIHFASIQFSQCCLKFQKCVRIYSVANKSKKKMCNIAMKTAH